MIQSNRRAAPSERFLADVFFKRPRSARANVCNVWETAFLSVRAHPRLALSYVLGEYLRNAGVAY